MKRKLSREYAFLAQFEWSFAQEPLDELLARVREDGADGLYTVDAFGEQLLRLYQANAAAVDAEIAAHLMGWEIDRISRTSRCLLQLSVAELLYGQPDMDSILINEAVELAKRYAGDKEYQFVNGVLGALSRKHHPDGQTGDKQPAAAKKPQTAGAPQPAEDRPGSDAVSAPAASAGNAGAPAAPAEKDAAPTC